MMLLSLGGVNQSVLVKLLEKFTTLPSGVSLYWFYLFTDKSGRDPVLKDAKVLFIVGKIYSQYLITVNLQFIAAIPTYFHWPYDKFEKRQTNIKQ